MPSADIRRMCSAGRESDRGSSPTQNDLEGAAVSIGGRFTEKEKGEGRGGEGGLIIRGCHGNAEDKEGGETARHGGAGVGRRAS